MSESVSKERLFRFKNILIEWTEKCEKTVNDIRSLADNLQEDVRRTPHVKAGGATAGIIGGALCAVGFGLSFVTFGASLGLSIAGGLIAGIGGVVGGGATARDAFLSQKKKKSAEEIVQEYRIITDAWKEECIAIGYSLEEILENSNSHLNMEEAFPKWYTFWFNLVVGTGNIGKNAGWNIIANTILTSLRIATSFDDVFVAGVKVGVTVFKNLGPVAKGLHITGGVVGIVLIPVDIYTLVSAAIDIHKDKPNETATALRKIADQLAKECPKKNDIEEMIEETSNLLKN